MKNAIIALVFLMYGSSSMAFEVFVTQLQGFRGPDIVFNYNFTACGGENTVSVAQAALDRWSYIPMSRIGHLRMGEAVSTTGAQVINQDEAFVIPPVMICDTSFNANRGGSGNDNTYGVGSPHYTNNQIVGGYILYNFDTSTAAGTSLTNSGAPGSALITHEVGHVLGLNHSNDPCAMMRSGANSTMCSDDYDGIRYLYPREEGLSNAFGCGLVGGGPNLPPPPPPWSLLLLMAPLLTALFLRGAKGAKLLFAPKRITV